MVRIYQAKDKAKLYARLESRKILATSEISASVRQIISQVRKEGDRALVRFTEQFDKVKLQERQLRVRPQTLRAAAKKADPSLLRDLEKAIFNIHAYHKRQVQKSWEYRKPGAILGQRVLPIDSVGVYVPGGSAAYPSSVLMNVIPAKIAGVPRIVVVTPPGTFQQHPIVAAALHKLNMTRSTWSGARWRRSPTARRLSRAWTRSSVPATPTSAPPSGGFRQVDIDMIAGPSEVVIMATAESNPRFIAADMLAGRTRRVRLLDLFY